MVEQAAVVASGGAIQVAEVSLSSLDRDTIMFARVCEIQKKDFHYRQDVQFGLLSATCWI